MTDSGLFSELSLHSPLVHMKIVFDPTTLHQSKAGSITSVIYFDFGGSTFPTVGWNDFVVVIVGWWLASLTRSADLSLSLQLRFMDGPYWISVSASKGSRVLLRCVEDRPGAGVVAETEIELEELKRELYRVSREIMAACGDAGFESADVVTLNNLLK